MLPSPLVSVFFLIVKHRLPSTVFEIYISWRRKGSVCLADPTHWPRPFFFWPHTLYKGLLCVMDFHQGLKKSRRGVQLSLQAQKKPAFFLGAPHAAMLLGVIFLSVSLLFLFFPEFQVPSKFLFFRASEGNHPNSYYFIRQAISIFLVKINCFRLWISMGLSSSIKQISPTIFYLWTCQSSLPDISTEVGDLDSFMFV